ncbi:hypothetical protein GCM10007966_02430 [Legionella impletisoli]|uniref:Uncharacterized protein n=1 Tax=Legionella impletisoli TaxID=343510 RepID=A0A917JQ79_9GAMM|nr:hypothetical protein GCM10007966_02430 [Legionella impletisoli]
MINALRRSINVLFLTPCNNLFSAKVFTVNGTKAVFLLYKRRNRFKIQIHVRKVSFDKNPFNFKREFYYFTSKNKLFMYDFR